MNDPDRVRLVVLRHAKAEPYAPKDRERRLTNRGRRDASDAGRYLADHALVPEAALVSSAARAQETWAEVQAACSTALLPNVDESLYMADPDDVLELVRQLPAEARLAIYVGHNPTAGELAQLLLDGEGSEPAVVQRLLGGFPTSAIAAFEFRGSWDGVEEGQGRLTDYYVGRG